MTHFSIEPPEIPLLLQRVTVKVVSPVETGSGVLCKPSPDSPAVYILTARHVIFGEGGLPGEVLPNGVSLQLLYESSSKQAFGKYALTANDRILVSENLADDFAVLIVSANEIESITGELPCLNLVRETYGLKNCLFRGFPEALKGVEPVRFNGEITEPVKSLWYQFEWQVSDGLADKWISTKSKTAYENVSGFSGSGVFLLNDSEVYLIGVVSKFGPFNRFIGEKVSLIENLLVAEDLPVPQFIEPEVRIEVRSALQKLKKNAYTEVVNRVSDTIGGTQHLQRPKLFDDLSEAIETGPLTIVYGEAGAGKSAVVKNCLNTGTHHLLAMKGEQICHDSLDASFRAIGIGVDSVALLSSPMLQGRIAMWIDGAEKCVERNQLGALLDVLRLTNEYPCLRVVITIRKYALEHFRLLVLTASRKAIFQEVLLLTQEEQNEITEHFPRIKSLFANQKLRRLLTVPFYLNYAVQLDETPGNKEPLDEQSFKEKIWTIVVDKGRLRRSEVFSTLALMRAKEMSLYVQPEKEDLDIVLELELDQLLIREAGSSNRFAPAHDIFEDWALVRFVRHAYRDNQQPKAFFEQLGPTYAIRRGFRFWLQEEAKRNTEGITQFVLSYFTLELIAPYWKDEAFIVIIQSDAGERFLDKNQAILLRDNSRLLLRFIHLFKTACKEPLAANPDMSEPWKMYSTNYVPVGSGWKSLVRFLHRHLEDIKDNWLVYSFIKDWSNKLSWEKPLPSEAREAGLILLKVFKRTGDDYIDGFHDERNGMRKETLRLIFRLTEVIKDEAKTILMETIEAIKAEKAKGTRLKGSHELIWEQMLFFFHCKEVCRFFPDIVMEAAWERWVDNVPKKKEYYRSSTFDTNQHFGLTDERRLDDFPESAFKTPIYWLLAFHSAKTLIWVVALLNYTTKKYVASEYAKNDDCVEILLTLNDGTTVKQYGNYVLYQMFRGTGKVTPYILQSALMALEKWLFEWANTKTNFSRKMLQEWCKLLLERSETVATTSVLVSIVMAYPEEIEELVYPILTSPEIYQWDTSRMVGESSALSPMGVGEYGQVYQQERAEANKMPHRKKRLEDFVIEQSFSNPPFREKFHVILDQLWKDVSLEQTTWRIFLHRMDIRKWEVTDNVEQDGKQLMMVQPRLDEDVRPIVEQVRRQHEETTPILGANLWAKKVFDREDGAQFSFDDWLIHYQLIRRVEQSELSGYAKTIFPPALIAAVAIRDCLDRLDEEQIKWCEKQLLARAQVEVHIERRVNLDWSFSVNHFEGVPTLFSLVLLLRKEHSREIRPKVVELLFESLLVVQFSDNIKKPFFDYVRENLWNINRDIAYACWAGLINYAFLWKKYPRYSCDFHSSDKTAKREMEQFEKDKLKLIEAIVSQTVAPQELPENLDGGVNWWLDKALRILPMNLQESKFQEFVEKYFNLLLHSAMLDDEDRGWHRQSSDFFESHRIFSEAFAWFIFKQRQEVALPLFDRLIKVVLEAKKYNRETFEFIDRCIEQVMWVPANDKNLDLGRFGFFWKHLLDVSIAAKNSRHFAARLLLESPYWYDHITDWKPIQENRAVFAEIVQKVGTTEPNSVVRLLGGIGSGALLPEGILWLCEILKEKGIEKVKIYDAEKLLNRIWVFHAREVRRKPVLLRNLMDVLDMMVEKGSSLAFFMREALF
jgi:hypothetical protein